MTIMPPLLLLLALVPGEADASTGYVHTGDLNGDGVPDSIRSGPFTTAFFLTGTASLSSAWRTTSPRRR